MERWWRDKVLIRAAREEYGSIEAAVHAIGGCSVSTAQKAWRDMGLERSYPGPQPRGEVNKEALRRLYEKVNS